MASARQAVSSRGERRGAIQAAAPREGRSRDDGSTSLLRALAILELVAHKPGGLTNSEISRRLKIPTSTSCYILERLEREGYVKRSGERGPYEISLKVVALAHGALRELGLRRAAEPILHRLAAETRYSGLIGVLDRGLVMIVDKVEQPNLAQLDMDLGVRYPAHTTAMGKVLLAHLPEEQFARIADGPNIGKTLQQAIASSSGLLRELAAVKKQGYGVSDGELFPHFWAIAAPIFDAMGQVRAAVSATGMQRPQDEAAIVDRIRRAAREISLRLTAADTIKLPKQRQAL